MAGRLGMAAILFFFVLWLSHCEGCNVDDVAVYKVTLRTLWSAERFPKDYPLFRPKAQWSQMFGQSHNSSYTLYQLGELAKESLRVFSQFGKLETLVREGDEEPRVYDQLAAPAIGAGVGETENMVFVDGGHSLVSLVSRIVPSPDWFVGVDSVDLCIDSSWVEQITLDLEPLDAGAASGLTFTAPRWETTPPEPVSRHGPRSPNHPAGGFFYPNLKELPAIAKVELVKVKEYSTKELNDLARNELLASLKLKDKRKGFAQSKNSVPKALALESDYEDEEQSSAAKQLKDLEEDPKESFGSVNPEDSNVEVVTQGLTTTTTTTEAEFDANLRGMDEVVLAVANGRKLGLGKHLPRHFRSRLHHAVNKLTSKDCLVSDWGEWTPCSATCGFGDKFRTRRVLREPTDEGRACPQLTDRVHCGNVNSCYNVDYFDW